LGQTEALSRTIESVRAQNYPEVEHIVVDRRPADALGDLLARAPHVKTIRQAFASNAEAMTAAMRSAGGDLFGMLNPGTTLVPGALPAMTSALTSGRHLAVGRCRFVDEDGRFLGLEHRVAVDDPDRILEIWKGPSVPSASTFWTRALWERCGPFDAHDDDRLTTYEFLCRASRSFTFYAMDSVLSEVSMPAGDTSAVISGDLIERAITVSRRYWGARLGPSYRSLAMSHLRFRFNRRACAVALIRRGRSQVSSGRWASGVLCGVTAAVVAPDVLPDVVVVPVLRRLTVGRTASGASAESPGKATLYADGWAGPDVSVTRRAGRGCRALCLSATLPPAGFKEPLSIDAEVDGRPLGSRMAGTGPDVHLVWPVDHLAPGTHEVRLRASGFVVPERDLGTADRRQLSFWVESLDFVKKI